jgi:hypothetical protein
MLTHPTGYSRSAEKLLALARAAIAGALCFAAGCAPTVSAGGASGAVTSGPIGGAAHSATSGNSGTATNSGTSAPPATTGQGSSTGTLWQESSSTGSSTTGTSGTTCPGYADPSTPASCTCQSGHTCTQNNCYGGYFCELANSKCVAPPSSCAGETVTTGTSSGSVTSVAAATQSSTSSSGATTGGGGGGPVTIHGGSVDTLMFAVIGDSRPGNLDDNAGYPTAVITKIYEDVQASGAAFVVATGDYQYATPTTTNGATQLDNYVAAMSTFTNGPTFPTMGNHECDGYTADNCDTSGNIIVGGSGLSNNYQAFVQKLLGPIGQTLPYYAFTVNVASPPSTAKFIFIAANAWDSAQDAWLKAQLQQTTDYTFVIRHEPAEAHTGPGVTPSESDLSAASFTVKIVGHVHEFAPPNTSGTTDAHEVCVGNGGASLENDGYALFSIDPQSGDVVVREMDYGSNSQLSTFTIPK